jgi:pimeloyl-ACP methyl ester carboxylesterase
MLLLVLERVSGYARWKREPPMPIAQTNSLEIYYETFGDPTHPTMLLLMGLGCQMVLWSPEFCQRIADLGYQVVRFDHRDLGQSSRLSHLRAPKLLPLLVKSQLRLPVSIPYTLRDMATDAIGLLDAIGVESAHWVGASMGGMIAQHAAIMAPHRLKSLCLWMTSPQRYPMPPPKIRVMRNLLRKPNGERAHDIELGVARLRSLSGGWLPFDEALTTGLVTQSVDRGGDPLGFLRQLAAVVTAPSRVKELSQLKIPTLVIHGKRDPMIPVSHAYDLAKIIPEARLEVFDDLGHDYPMAAWPRLISSIHRHAASVEA